MPASDLKRGVAACTRAGLATSVHRAAMMTAARLKPIVANRHAFGLVHGVHLKLARHMAASSAGRNRVENLQVLGSLVSVRLPGHVVR